MYQDCKQCSNELLYVIGVVSNPARFTRRYQLFNEWVERMNKNPKVYLLTVELQQGCRDFVTNSDIKLKTKHELWHKENLINIGVQHLPKCWKYMAWIDTDIEFINKNWAEEALCELQTYDIVQLFSHAVDLGPKGETLQIHTGFCYQHINGVKWKKPGYATHMHPGFGFAITRKAYNYMGGLLDFPILGSADNHMCLCWIGEGKKSLPKYIHPNYRKLILIYQDRCEKHIKRNIGCIPGTIYHYWHGDKADRQYASRWKILEKYKFDPLVDIKKDCHDLWQLEGDKYDFRDALRRYFRARNEDSISRFQPYKYTKIDWL